MFLLGSTSAGVAWAKRVARGFREDGVRGSRTFAVYEDLCAISVRPHQYSLIVYLFLCQAWFEVDDFQELGVVSVWGCLVDCDRRTHGVGDAVGESHKFNVVAGALPVGVQGEDEPQGRCLGVGMAIGEGDVAEVWGDGRLAFD